MGARLSGKTKDRLIQLIIDNPSKTSGEIARLCGVAESTVYRYRQIEKDTPKGLTHKEVLSMPWL